jgi:hypothetical protein
VAPARTALTKPRSARTNCPWESISSTRVVLSC